MNNTHNPYVAILSKTSKTTYICIMIKLYQTWWLKFNKPSLEVGVLPKGHLSLTLYGKRGNDSAPPSQNFFHQFLNVYGRVLILCDFLEGSETYHQQFPGNWPSSLTHSPKNRIFWSSPYKIRFLIRGVLQMLWAWNFAQSIST